MKKHLRPSDPAEPHRAMNRAAKPRHPQIVVGDRQPVDPVIAQTVVLGQHDLHRIAPQFKLPTEPEHNITKPHRRARPARTQPPPSPRTRPTSLSRRARSPSRAPSAHQGCSSPMSSAPRPCERARFGLSHPGSAAPAPRPARARRPRARFCPAYGPRSGGRRSCNSCIKQPQRGFLQAPDRLPSIGRRRQRDGRAPDRPARSWPPSDGGSSTSTEMRRRQH